MDLLNGKLAHLNKAAIAFTSLNVNSDQGTYLEIGSHKGRSIVAFANILKQNVKKLHLIGYDIFGLETKEFHSKEDNGKGAGDYNKCNQRLSKVSKRNPNITFELIAGYTTDTLKPTSVDWVYIDGGHSYETVKWDHQQLKDSRVIVFDDSDLTGVNKYLWEIKDQYNLYSLYGRQAIIINDTENFDFDRANLQEFVGQDPATYQAKR